MGQIWHVFTGRKCLADHKVTNKYTKKNKEINLTFSEVFSKI